jgi:hypothetical protein
VVKFKYLKMALEFMKELRAEDVRVLGAEEDVWV